MSQSAPQKPRFLATVAPAEPSAPRFAVVPPTPSTHEAKGPARPSPLAPPPSPPVPRALAGDDEATEPSPTFVPGPAAPAPSRLAEPSGGLVIDERVARAIDDLVNLGQRMADRVRSDALEIGFMVARRILEAEVSTSVEPLFVLIRSAIRRLGESGNTKVRLCPKDLARVEAARETGHDGALTLAQVTLVADPELKQGDVVVESDAGAVDGRLDSRLAELRRAADRALESKQS